jgi:large subunit ribosomal protein L41
MKATACLSRDLRRLALTTKSANKGFYKGTGTGSVGRHTKHGNFVIEWDKVRTYVVPPDLKSFQVRMFAFVLHATDLDS